MNSNIPITTGQIEILQTREELRRVKITPFRMRHYSTRRPKRKIGKYISRKQIRMSNFILTSIIVNNMFFPSDGTAFIGACQRGVFIRRQEIMEMIENAISENMKSRETMVSTTSTRTTYVW
ncbi:hypothetical protein D918_01010 [Trichuris suis]|nr:hypothetical protein D918_01010 [Trichuris suis]